MAVIENCTYNNSAFSIASKLIFKSTNMPN